MIGFNPQNPATKKQGREEIAKALKIPLRKFKGYFQPAVNFMPAYNQFVSDFPVESRLISDMKPNGVGPGELIAWFLFHDITLGGRNSRVDLLQDGEPFAEVKAGTHRLVDNSLVDFKISKDSDAAVDLLRGDLQQLNENHFKITGSFLPGFLPGTISTTTLQSWEKVNLLKLSKQHAGPVKGFVDLKFEANGNVYQASSTAKITNWYDVDFQVKVKRFLLSDIQIPVDTNTATLSRIIKRWRKQAWREYLKGKQLALINTRTLEMMHFGEVSEKMISLYRVGRNQPWAKIYLPREENG